MPSDYSTRRSHLERKAQRALARYSRATASIVQLDHRRHCARSNEQYQGRRRRPRRYTSQSAQVGSSHGQKSGATSRVNSLLSEESWASSATSASTATNSPSGSGPDAEPQVNANFDDFLATGFRSEEPVPIPGPVIARVEYNIWSAPTPASPAGSLFSAQSASPGGPDEETQAGAELVDPQAQPFPPQNPVLPPVVAEYDVNLNSWFPPTAASSAGVSTSQHAGHSGLDAWTQVGADFSDYQVQAFPPEYLVPPPVVAQAEYGVNMNTWSPSTPAGPAGVIPQQSAPRGEADAGIKPDADIAAFLEKAFLSEDPVPYPVVASAQYDVYLNSWSAPALASPAGLLSSQYASHSGPDAGTQNGGGLIGYQAQPFPLEDLVLPLMVALAEYGVHLPAWYPSISAWSAAIPAGPAGAELSPLGREVSTWPGDKDVDLNGWEWSSDLLQGSAKESMSNESFLDFLNGLELPVSEKEILERAAQA